MGNFARKSLIVAHFASLQIDRDLVVVDVLRPLHQFRNFILAQLHGQESILGAVVGENSANEDEITARKPKSASAHTACSRDDPQPKFLPATRMLAPS